MTYDIDPSMAAKVASQQDLTVRRREMESLSHSGNEAERQAKMQKACEGFEAVFIQKMWEQMRASLPKEGLMKGKEEEYWQSMYDQELGKSMASVGGIGLADMMMVQLNRNNQDISDATRGSAMRRPTLNVSPVPLLPPSITVEHKAQAATQSETAHRNPPVPHTPPSAFQTAPGNTVMSMYDGEASTEAPLQGENPANAASSFASITTPSTGNSPVYPSASAEALASVSSSPSASSAPGMPVAVADETPVSVRQTLDELERQTGMDPRGTPPPGQPGQLAEPVVTHITYQTNLPPSQRKAEPAQQHANFTAQPRPLSTGPTVMSGTAGLPAAGNVSGYVPTTPPASSPTSASATLTAPVFSTADAASVPQGSEPVTKQDILAGIKSRFIPTRFMASTDAASAGMAAMTVSRPGTLAETDVARPAQAGGPSLAAPEEVVAPVSLGNPEPPKGSLDAPVSGEISSGFGWRIDPFTGQRAWHAGVDIKAASGEGVRAAMDGVVTFAGPHSELGNLVVVDHGDGLRTYYGHNQNLEVSVGQSIKSGMELAQAGSSGRAAGTHVHFEVRRGELALNPEPLLRQHNVQVAEVR